MPDNNPFLARYMAMNTDDQADAYARRYDYKTDPSLRVPSLAELAALEEAYASINGARPVQNDPGKAQPITDPVVDSNPLTAANTERLRQQAIARPVTQADREAAATREYDRRYGRQPLNDPPAPMAPPTPMVPMAPDPYAQRAAVEQPEVGYDGIESPARQFTAEMQPRGEDPRVRIPGIRSQEVNPGILEDDYIVGYDPYGQPVRRSIAPHASDYQTPATNKWSGAQSFDQQADKRQLIAMKIMIDGGILPERAERLALGKESMTQREATMLQANQKAQRNRQNSQETDRRRERMGDYYDGN